MNEFFNTSVWVGGFVFLQLVTIWNRVCSKHLPNGGLLYFLLVSPCSDASPSTDFIILTQCISGSIWVYMYGWACQHDVACMCTFACVCQYVCVGCHLWSALFCLLPPPQAIWWLHVQICPVVSRPRTIRGEVHCWTLLLHVVRTKTHLQYANSSANCAMRFTTINNLWK